MSKIEQHIELLKKYKLSTIVRTNDYDHAYNIVKGSYLGGIRFIEITLTCPNALELITKCKADFPELLIGAGTVLTIEEADDSIKAGADYLVSPICDYDLVSRFASQDILVAAAGVTPTEMYKLVAAGAKLVKFFPATIADPEYVKIIHNPFPDMPLLATGGITYDNVDKFIENGCIGCGVTDDLGGAPVGTSVDEIAAIAKKYVDKISKFI